MSFINEILSEYTSQDFILYLFIFLITVVFLWEYRHLYSIFQLSNTLEAAGKNLSKIYGDDAKNNSNAFNPFKPSQIELYSDWQEFIQQRQKTLISNSNASTTEVAYYFNWINIIGGNQKIRKLDSISGIFLSLGILGTFIGISWGLWGINLYDSAKILISVRQLIGGLQTAFISSICGIIASLLFLIIEKRALKKVNIQSLKFQEEAEKVFPSFSQEQISSRLLEIEEEELQHIKTLSTDLSTTLSDSIGNVFDERLSPVLNDLKNTINSFSEITANNQTEGLKKLINSFLSNMDEAVGDQFNDLGQTVRNINIEFRELATKLSETADKQDKVILQSVQAVEVISQQLPALLHFGQGMEKISEDLGGTVEKIEGLQNSLNESAEANIRAQHAVAESLDGAADSLSKSVQALMSASERIASSEQTIQDTFNTAMERFNKEVKDGLIDILASFDSKLSDILQRFSGSLFNVRENIDVLMDASQIMNETVSSANEGIKEGMNNLVNEINTIGDSVIKFSELSLGLQSQTEAVFLKVSSAIEGLPEKISKKNDADISPMNSKTQ